MRTFLNLAGVALCCVFVLASGESAFGQQSTKSVARDSKITQSPPVKARLWCIPENCEDPATAKRQGVDVTLIGRNATHLIVAGEGTGSVPGRVLTGTVVGVDFELEYDRFVVTKAMVNNDWAKAIGILTKVYTPTYLYLDLPENNALEGVMDLGTTMMKFAKRTLRHAKSDEERNLAKQQFEAAYKVFQACSKAEWSNYGAVGKLKACHCLISIDAEKAKIAQRRVDNMDEPTPGDGEYGHYWLLKAELAMLANNPTNAMDAAVKSLCFENKDVETFPDALMISADCYEKLGNYYRARDVYFEVAKLFPGTDWATDALAGLEAIMDSGKTAKKEAASAESTFFGLEEDMNALVEALIKERKNAKPVFANDYEEETENDN